MKEILYIVIEYIISYALIFLLYYFLFIRKQTKYNKDKVPIEYAYLVGLYKLNEKKINYKKFIYQIAFINCFILSTTYIIVSKLISKFIWQLLGGIVIIGLLIVICYELLGRYYQKRGKKDV